MKAKEQIRRFVLENHHVPDPEGLGDGDSLLREGIIDSVGILDLVAFLEQNFGIKIADKELLPENFDSIDRIVAYVMRKRGA